MFLLINIKNSVFFVEMLTIVFKDIKREILWQSEENKLQGLSPLQGVNSTSLFSRLSEDALHSCIQFTVRNVEQDWP